MTRVLLGRVTQAQSNVIFVGYYQHDVSSLTLVTARADRNIPFAPGEYKHLKRKTSAAWLSESLFRLGGGSPLGLNLALGVDFAQAAVSAASKRSRGGYEEFDTKGGKERMPRSAEAFSGKRKKKKHSYTSKQCLPLYPP